MLKSAFGLSGGAALVTVTVYVFFVTPSSAVASTLISVLPTTSPIALDALPLVTTVLFTFTVTSGCAIGVTVKLSTSFATLAV
ncbi:hypothetical protein D3C73_1327130 [compost metagenome]